MLRKLRNRKGQNTAEYAILAGVVIAAAIGMQTYVRRSLQAHVKDASDYALQEEVGAAGVFNTSQYVPYYMDSNTKRTETARRQEQVSEQGVGLIELYRENASIEGTVIQTNYSLENL